MDKSGTNSTIEMVDATDALPQLQPFDEYNRELRQNASPPDWTNPTAQERYNLVVVGGGTAGLVTAAGAAGLGAKVALIERRLLGGDCLNVGCVPSKALLRSARAVADVRNANLLGVRTAGDPQVDFPAVMERMRRVRAQISPHDSAQRFRDLGIDVFLGDAKFTGPQTIAVDGQTLRFARACIATGGRPAEPPIPGLHEAGFLTNETVFSLTQLPPRFALLGAGPIGCEMAQAFARFGADVQLIEMTNQILGREDVDAARIVEQCLRCDGVQLHLETKLKEVRRQPGETVLVLESKGGATRELVVDEILVGVGRVPNVQGLDLEAAGVEYDERRGVTVNDFLQTTNRRIYAAGDVCFPYKFTHTADALARIAIRNALFFGRERTSTLTVPWCTYTDPEVAHVGIYPGEAAEKGIEIDTITIDMGQVDRAVIDSEECGFLKVHLRRKTDKIVGATLVARHAGEMISEITLAMVSGSGLRAIANTIHPYPTQAEVIKKAADNYSRSRLTPRLRGAFERLLRWRR